MELKAFVKHVFRKSFLQHQHFCTGPFVLKADNLLVFWSSSIEIGDRCSRAAHKKSFDSIHLSDRKIPSNADRTKRGAPDWSGGAPTIMAAEGSDVSPMTARLMSLIRSEEKSREDLRTRNPQRVHVDTDDTKLISSI